MTLRRLDAAHCGARDVEAYSGGGCAGMAGHGEVLAFDGARYRSRASFECGCPVSSPDVDRDPRCPPAE